MGESRLSDRSERWLLFNANSAIFQTYHGDNKLLFNEARDVRDQQSVDIHITPLWHIILIPSQPFFVLTP
jgi:hypothetical protein